MPTPKSLSTKSTMRIQERCPDDPEASDSTKSTFSLKAADFIQPPAPTASQKKNGKKVEKAEEPYLIVGFDTEFKGPDEAVTRDEIKEGEAKYRVLSYQFHCRLQSGEQWSGVGCPDQDERISLGQFLVFALGSRN